MCHIAKAYCIKATSNGTCVNSMNKLIKTLLTLYSKYDTIENLRPVFMALKSIFEKKEKAMTGMQEIIDEMDQQGESESDSGEKSGPASLYMNDETECYPDQTRIGKFYVSWFRVQMIGFADDSQSDIRKDEFDGTSCAGPVQPEAKERRPQIACLELKLGSGRDKGLAADEERQLALILQRRVSGTDRTDGRDVP